MVKGKHNSHVVIEEVTDPVEIERFRRRHEQFERNLAWYEAHIDQITDPANRGRCICIAGRELFVGDDAQEVAARARAAHPDDEGLFVEYVPIEKMPRIYAL